MEEESSVRHRPVVEQSKSVVCKNLPLVERIAETIEAQNTVHVRTEAMTETALESTLSKDVLTAEQQLICQDKRTDENNIPEKLLIDIANPSIDSDAVSGLETNNHIPISESIPTIGRSQQPSSASNPQFLEGPSLQEIETATVGADILFSKNSLDVAVDAFTNLKWSSTNGVRKVRFCGNVTRLAVEKKGLFGLRTADAYHARKLCIYDYPSLILILRSPQDVAEVQTLLDVPPSTDIGPLSSYLLAETVVDPKACKLRLSTLTTVTSIENVAVDPRRRTCFELVTPTDSILLSCVPLAQMSFVNSVTFFETKKMEVAVGNALFDAHSQSDEKIDITRKHQLILGTLHSYVILGSQSLLDQAIRAAMPEGKRVPTHIIDAVDEGGRTALHYACERRNAAAVTVLIGAGCDATICLGESTTPCHLSATMLDEKSLSTILTATFPTRPNPNALDHQGRTPMYLATMEGCRIGNEESGLALAHCLQALEAWGGTMLVKGSTLPHPVTLLASDWQHETLTTVLNNIPCRYPLPIPGISVGALYCYPIHTAILSFRRKVLSIKPGEKDFRISEQEKLNLIRTISQFLEHGFEPNERIEGSLLNTYANYNISQYFGFSPIQILVSTALDLVSLKTTKIGIGVEDNVANVIAACGDRLLRSGARLNLEPPPISRLSRRIEVNSGDPEKKEETIDRSGIKIESRKDLINIFGGDMRIKAAKKFWSEHKTVIRSGKTFIQQDITRTETTDSDAPGGSDEKSCAVCWAVFGMIMNRKHRCRVTQRYVCDDCSSKRITEGKDEHRISDGQFSLAVADQIKACEDQMTTQTEQIRERQEQLLQRQAIRKAQIEEEKTKKDSLFGGMMEHLGFGDEDNQKDNISSLENTLGQTRDALNERGDKLNSLSEKTEKLMEASSEFERMAKALERSQSGGFFW